MASLSTTWATTRKDFNGGDGGLSGDIVLSFPVTASTSLNQGDFVKLTSSNLLACTATTDVCVGVCMQDVDNSDGAAGDLSAPVLVRGMARVNCFIEGTGLGSYDDALAPWGKLGLSGDSGTTVANGQALSAGADPTVQVGICMSTQAVAAGPVLISALAYIDTMGLPDQA